MIYWKMQRYIIFATDSVDKQNAFVFSLEHFSYSEVEGLPDSSFTTTLYVCLDATRWWNTNPVTTFCKRNKLNKSTNSPHTALRYSRLPPKMANFVCADVMWYINVLYLNLWTVLLDRTYNSKMEINYIPPAYSGGGAINTT